MVSFTVCFLSQFLIWSWEDIRDGAFFWCVDNSWQEMMQISMSEVVRSYLMGRNTICFVLIWPLFTHVTTVRLEILLFRETGSREPDHDRFMVVEKQNKIKKKQKQISNKALCEREREKKECKIPNKGQGLRVSPFLEHPSSMDIVYIRFIYWGLECQRLLSRRFLVADVSHFVPDTCALCIKQAHAPLGNLWAISASIFKLLWLLRPKSKISCQNFTGFVHLFLSKCRSIWILGQYANQ